MDRMERLASSATSAVSGMGDITYLGVNQDATCIIVVTTQGFTILDVETCQALLQETFEACGPVLQAEMLFQTSLLALVGEGGLLTMWDASTHAGICTMRFSSEICSVRLNHRRTVVLLQHQIHIFDLKTMKRLLVVDRDVPSSPSLASLCADGERGYLATPLHGPAGVGGGEGFVALMDTHTLQAFVPVLAHRSPVQALGLNSNGTRLATASTKGTVIRVFSTPSLHLLHTFRRGVNPSRVFGLLFLADSSHLATSSSSGTVHLFRIPGTQMVSASRKHAAKPLRLGPTPPCKQQQQQQQQQQLQASLQAAGVSQQSQPEQNVEAPDTTDNRVQKLKSDPLIEGAGEDEESDDLKEWSVIPDTSCGIAAGSDDLGPRAKAAKSLMWQLFGSWQERADAPCSFAWMRLHMANGHGHANTSDVAGAGAGASFSTSFSSTISHTASEGGGGGGGSFVCSSSSNNPNSNGNGNGSNGSKAATIPFHLACPLPGCKVAVAAVDGSFRLYGWNAASGGEGELLARRALLEHSSALAGGAPPTATSSEGGASSLSLRGCEVATTTSTAAEEREDEDLEEHNSFGEGDEEEEDEEEEEETTPEAPSPERTGEQMSSSDQDIEKNNKKKPQAMAVEEADFKVVTGKKRHGRRAAR